MKEDKVVFGAWELAEGWLGYYQVKYGNHWQVTSAAIYDNSQESAIERAITEYESTLKEKNGGEQ